MASAKEPNLSFDFDALVPKNLPTKPESATAPALVSIVSPNCREEPIVFTVAAIARRVQGAFDSKFPDAVWVEGEASGVKNAPSGHVYLALKDPEVDACLDVVAYRSSITPKARALLREGQAVRVRGRFAFYAARGRTQFLVDRVEPTGKGALLLALERLKEKLQAEGLFDPAKKRQLPASPRIIGVVTSRSGAVLHDIHKVAFRRGGAHLLLSAALVQGASAPEELRRALQRLSCVHGVDVIILARGGGSAEDLAAFNDEALVRAVAACRVPIISAIGHETDVTLCDFAADVRASTPSQAAELIVPDSLALRAALAERSLRLHRALTARIDRARLELGRIDKRLGDPRLLLARAQQRLDELQARQAQAARRRVRILRSAVDTQARSLAAAHPRTVLGRAREQLQTQRARVQRSFERRLADDKRSFGNRIERLSALSPLAVLSRGYAIVSSRGDAAVRSAASVQVGDTLHVRLGEGSLVADVRAIHRSDES